MSPVASTTLSSNVELCPESKSPIVSRWVKSPLGLVVVKGCTKGVHFLRWDSSVDFEVDENKVYGYGIL